MNLLDQLAEKTHAALGSELVALVLYGSAAGPEPVDKDYSDVNVLCVLTQITADELRRIEPVLDWWAQWNRPEPLFMTEREIATSADCFPIEFRDMQRRRRVLCGRDVIADIAIGNAHYRTQVEYELRTRLIRLRQKAAVLARDPKLLRRLLLQSVSTFCILARHALELSGSPAPDERRAALRAAAERFELDCSSLEQLLDVREGKRKAAAIEPVPVLNSLMAQVSRLIEAVDAMDGVP